ncbi:unnamed protein product [Fraxinus pennsylvanica]|uniref:Uncharacterized protein n=1 Tax=Fraxinus pennsylvanica TaxID=56036 RepID=A0AAD1Z707_9LAMI|nr:unnamed protein product [Fraxinus pennsylvanica]
MALAAIENLGPNSAHDFPIRPVIAQHSISPLGFTITAALSLKNKPGLPPSRWSSPYYSASQRKLVQPAIDLLNEDDIKILHAVLSVQFTIIAFVTPGRNLLMADPPALT